MARRLVQAGYHLSVYVVSPPAPLDLAAAHGQRPPRADHTSGGDERRVRRGRDEAHREVNREDVAVLGNLGVGGVAAGGVRDRRRLGGQFRQLG